MKNKKILSALLIAVLLLSIFRLEAFANSARRLWEGVSMTGAVVADRNCPVEIENEKLTFDISEFPSSYYEKEDDFLAYSGRVTAEYTFYNPADYNVTAKLVFPFGSYPSYEPHEYNENTGMLEYSDDTDKYGIWVNGEEIAHEIRHTLSDIGDFDINKDMSLIKDDFIKDGFYTPSLTVTKYTYEMSGINKEEYRAASAGTDIGAFDGKRKFWLEDASGYDWLSDEKCRLGMWADNGIKINLYVIGEPLKEAPDWKFYKDGGNEDGAEIDGKMSLLSTKTLSFKELALSSFREGGRVSETDWYNASVAFLNKCEIEKFGVIKIDGTGGLDISELLERWYEYEITLKPGEKIVNTIEAPLYPSIDLSYDPGVYGYTYLLSPASTWAKFGKLDININTPFYMTECDKEGFVKTGSGYFFTSDGLPDGELNFSLSESPNPKTKQNGMGIIYFFFLLILGFVPYVVGALAVIIVIILILGRKRKK